MAPSAGAFAVLSAEIELKRKEKINILFNKLFITFFVTNLQGKERSVRAACSTSFRHIDLDAGALAAVVAVVVVGVEERSAILLHCRVCRGSAAVVVVIVVPTACC